MVPPTRPIKSEMSSQRGSMSTVSVVRRMMTKRAPSVSSIPRATPRTLTTSASCSMTHATPEQYSEGDAEDADNQRFLLDDPRDSRARHAQRLQHADLPRPLRHRRVHGEQDDEDADDRGDADDHVNEDVERGHARRVKLRQVARKNYLVVGEDLADARGHGILLRGVVARDEYRRAVASTTDRSE